MRTDLPTDPAEVAELLRQLRGLVRTAETVEEARAVTSRIARVTRAYRLRHGIGIPATLAEQAVELDAGYRVRPHLRFLSDQISGAVRDVERGENRMLAVSMPPRSGKSTLISKHGPLWLLRQHPDWSIVTVSHDGALVTDWARYDRKIIEEKPSLGIRLAPDGGAGSHWETIEGGGLRAVSWRGPLTGRGAKVMIIDDPVANFVDAHSASSRQALWDWWRSVGFTRLEAPYLVLVVMTRWHEDDLVGRLFSNEYEGDPSKWEKISLPAIADREDDALGRAYGDPLISPLVDEDHEGALKRLGDIKIAVGSYTWASMYQQRPAPAKGAIFDSGWWRYWTSNPELVTEDGKVVYLDPSSLIGGKWLDSWDCAFKSTASSDWVVGQRWVRARANRYLVAQKRGRWSFTRTIAEMRKWAITDNPSTSPCGHLVHQRLIEERANGAAIIDVLKEEIAGLKPINPIISKEARARAVTPECESGNVYLPHPSDPGNEWMADFLTELRNFPHDAADDQVDSLTQALAGLRDPGRGLLTVPGNQVRQGNRIQIGRDIARTAAAAARPRSVR